ncbi:MAG: fibrillarin-like rRNA/tRNA 2'-O-methyltransferase, partial [Methanomassiliicoccales archaeon]|nr:fibrillarin-like rRNA/tRNA 2'-O-methyltransferase [Methanomassiliicoccales archaeon]
TRNSVPGDSVYGERLISVDETEYREWMPNRSKLAAYVRLGGTVFPFSKESRVLYLGAASGTTASHVADLCSSGTIYCVEFSPRSFRDLVSVCERRRNMVPILGDATKPSEYRFAVEHVDVVYQDIAQKNQASILMKNMREFDARTGMLALKARCEDVTREPGSVFSETAFLISKEGFEVLDLVDLEPFEKDHAMIAVGRK